MDQIVATALPELIDPWQPFKEMRAITHTVGIGIVLPYEQLLAQLEERVCRARPPSLCELRCRGTRPTR